MNFVRKIISSSKLDNIIDIPESLKNRDVELIILPLEVIDRTEKNDTKFDSAKGNLRKYQNKKL